MWRLRDGVPTLARAVMLWKDELLQSGMLRMDRSGGLAVTERRTGFGPIRVGSPYGAALEAKRGPDAAAVFIRTEPQLLPSAPRTLAEGPLIAWAHTVGQVSSFAWANGKWLHAPMRRWGGATEPRGESVPASVQAVKDVYNDGAEPKR